MRGVSYFELVLFVLPLVVLGSPILHRALRSLHDIKPLSECNQIIGPVRCGKNALGYRDADVTCCNGTKCHPPTTVTSQVTDGCSDICLNGGTPNPSVFDEAVPCLCPKNYVGLFCQKLETECGQLHLESEGVIISSGFNGLAEDLKCIYEIRTDPANPALGLPGKRIVLYAEEFQVHPLEVTEEDIAHSATKCPDNNRVSVYQRKLSPGFQFRKGGFCGTNSFRTIVSDSHVMYVEVIHGANSNGQGNKIRLKYKTIINEPRHFCEGSWGIQSMHGTIATPAFPFHHPPDIQCFWVIFVKPGHTVELDFTSVDIQEQHSDLQECVYDRIMVLAHKQGKGESFCGSHSHKKFTFVDPNKVYILLLTNDLIQGTGFSMDFHQYAANATISPTKHVRKR